MSSLRKKSLSGLLWTFSQQFGVQFINFLVSIVLARILLPEDFGLIGMILVFLSIGNTLVDSGLTSSLIRSEDANEIDFSTVFYINIFGSIFIYLLVFFLAPIISEFYDQPILVSITRVLCLTFIIQAFSSVQKTRLTKILDFKTQAIVTFPSIIVGSVIGLVLAFYDFGVWSLVYLNLSQSLAFTTFLWFKSGWRPLMVFDYNKLKHHFEFGYKLTLSGLLNTLFDNIYYIIIGKYFSAAQLGYYTRANSFKQLPIKNISTALNKVTYPIFATIQNEDVKLKSVYKKLMQQVLFWIAPTMTIGIILAEPLFRFLLTEKWLPAVPFFQLLCIVGIMYPLHAYNLNILKVKGRSDLFLKLEAIKKILLSIGLVISVPLGIMAMIWMQVIFNFVAFGINTYYSGSMIGYHLKDQLRDIIPIIGLSIFTGLLLLTIDDKLVNLQVIDMTRLFLGTIVFFGIYLGLAVVFKFKPLAEFKELVIRK